ncbi:sugar ABC transporter permease [Mumia zhuanghuii]|uniref:Carbohydrate ABC transporter permease n=2 Tax=Mumia TaxID=1546255 RepID=A0ABW1QFY6_9ACTN|nr:MULTISPECIES: sugar ABC transporter permease [Mumia]KAA1424629.1 sugar ABC transporter permease [Mumia zhuanghuii]
MHLRDRLARIDIHGAPYLFIAPFFLLFGIFGLFPLGYTLWVSLHDWTLLGGNEGWVGFGNYTELFSDDYFWNSLLNTFAIFLIATIPQMLVALGLAQVLNASLRAITFWRVGVIIPTATSVAAVGIIFTMAFSRDFGIVNWMIGLVGVDPIAWNQERIPSWIAIATMVDWRWTGYNALILLAALQAVPKDLYESARLDGASAARQFWSITIPMLRPTLMFVVTVSTIGGIQLFTEPLLFNPGANAITGGDMRQFQTSAMYVVEQAFTGQRFGYAATVAWVLFAVIVLVSLVNSLLVRRIRSAD